MHIGDNKQPQPLLYLHWVEVQNNEPLSNPISDVVLDVMNAPSNQNDTPICLHQTHKISQCKKKLCGRLLLDV